ncbi:hypothetical protein BM613_03170 [Sulfoacidibacillus thermotolerans]|uniref:Cell division protein DivIVA n=2 Tax=Sulfoacidibacillus thermotolerans TaxID=1765684 RepID=A0A2U3DB69_SULT2|nr:hypothetical protein BM613_03170 [Sulfoacidibacillus thermotolerans]
MEKHYYTVEEANALLPQIKRQIMELRKAREELALMRLALVRKQKENKDGNSDDFFKEEAQIEFSLLTARQQIDHLLTLSIEVKDIDTGLVDFLTTINGEDAYLCWRDGEAKISHWHGLTEGFAERKTLPGDPSSSAKKM